MKTRSREYKSDFARHYYAEGEAKGEAKSVLIVLEARGVPVSEEARVRIVGCTDLAVLESWVVRAMTAGSVEELFD